MLSIGQGGQLCIYQTDNGGVSRVLRFRNQDARVFLDALSFWDKDHGIALGDPVDGRFTVLATDDGGMNWKPTTAARMPQAKEGEGAFAASGTCLVVDGG